MTPRTARETVFRALARGLAPPPDIRPSEWSASNLRVPDGPKAGQLWDPQLAPYLAEIFDHMAPTSAATLVAVRKSAQVGYTQLLLGWMGYVVDIDPARTLMVLPTVPVAQDFNRDKLGPTIEQTRPLREKVRKQTSRSSGGSTALNKRFPGGGIVITGANSSADLRSKTVKYAACDEVDDWPWDLDGQGDPMRMVEARQRSFTATGDWKRLVGSTPTMKGQSRIEDLFAAGDQRFWEMPCPHCGEHQVMTFFPDADGRGGLRFNKTFPFEAHYSCRHCGCDIEHHQKAEMVRAGRWKAHNPGPGRHPSYHIDALISLVTTWDTMAEAFIDAKDDPASLKTFWNLWLGLAWEERGEAPEWQRLFGRREEYVERTIPLGGLVLTAFCDVQKDGLFYEVLAWGEGRVSWVVEANFLPGETADPTGDVWKELERVYERTYRNAFGREIGIDLFGVDSGYNTQAVYEWCRRRPRAMATKGQPGWSHPPVGTPTKQDVTIGGKKLRRGLMLWPLGTWPLKATLYGWLRKDGRRDGAEDDPPGYCHFGSFLPEGYFQQITAEYLKDRTVKGRTVKEWVASGPNHYHDCRIGNMALAEHLGIGRMTGDEWAVVRGQREVPDAGGQRDLLTAADAVRPKAPPRKPPAEPVQQSKPEPPAASSQEGGGFLSGSRRGSFLQRKNGWLS